MKIQESDHDRSVLILLPLQGDCVWCHPADRVLPIIQFGKTSPVRQLVAAGCGLIYCLNFWTEK